MGVLDDELDDLEEDLEEAEDIIGDDPGPLSEPQRSALAARLDSAEGRIDAIFNGNGAPKLTPPDAGSIDPSVLPATLPEFAGTCLALARDAHEEALADNPNHCTIGTKLKTIKSLFCDFRQLSGIN